MNLEQVDKMIRLHVAGRSPKLIRLHMAITESFDASQVGHICELLGANYSKLRGIANRDKIRELLLYLDRRGQLDDLVEICHQLQPGFHWEDRPLVLEIPAFAQHISLEDLSTILATHFSLDDLKQLAFCLGIGFEAIPAPHLMFGTTHNLSERSKQWLQSVGIDYNSMSAKELDARLNKMWVEGFVDECKRGADWKRAVAICAQLRPDVLG